MDMEETIGSRNSSGIEVKKLRDIGPWPDEKNLLLFKYYEKTPLLWRKGDPDYCKVNKRRLAEERIGRKLGVSASEIKARWTSMRQTFFKTLNAERLAQSGRGLKKKKHWKFMNCLSFLSEVSVTDVKPEQFPIDNNSSDENPCNSQPVLKKRKEHDYTVVVPSQRNYQKDHPEVYPKEDVNDATIMAKGWSIQYAELSNRQKILARKIISDVLFHGCLGHLNEYSVQDVQNILDPSERITSPEGIFVNSCNSSEFNLSKNESNY